MSSCKKFPKTQSFILEMTYRELLRINIIWTVYIQGYQYLLSDKLLPPYASLIVNLAV